MWWGLWFWLHSFAIWSPPKTWVLQISEHHNFINHFLITNIFGCFVLSSTWKFVFRSQRYTLQESYQRIYFNFCIKICLIISILLFLVDFLNGQINKKVHPPWNLSCFKVQAYKPERNQTWTGLSVAVTSYFFINQLQLLELTIYLGPVWTSWDQSKLDFWLYIY